MTTIRNGKRFHHLSDSLDIIEFYIPIAIQNQNYDQTGFWKEFLGYYNEVTNNTPTLGIYLQQWVNNIIAAGKGLGLVNSLNVGSIRQCLCIIAPPPIGTKPQKRKDGRYPFPAEFVRFYKRYQDTLQLPWEMRDNLLGKDGGGTKVTISWVQAFLSGNVPDKNIVGWEDFDLSHLCGRKYDFCLDPVCGVWESKAANQSRGGDSLCRRKCNHCFITLCACQGYHNPTCL